MIAPTLTFWWRLFAMLVVEGCCLAALGFVAQRLAHSVFWRRAGWQIIIVCLLATAVSEWTGVGKAVGLHFAPRAQSMGNALASNIGPMAGRERAEIKNIAVSPSLPEKQAHVVWWPGLVGLAGTLLVLGRTVLGQGVLLALRFSQNRITEGPLLERLARLSPRLGLRRKISLRRMSSLVSPMASGILRPCIGLPAQFETRFSPAEQDAVLAHELAHLSSRDPLWFLLADLAAAILWWHPAAWWARQRLHVTSEQAADEATALVPDGPKALAQCLVALGKEMANMGAWGWVGINGGGFRSNLGRRVENLLQLSASPPRSLSRGVSAIKIAAMLAAAPLTVLAFGSMQTNQGPSDETWACQVKESWRQSPAGVMLLAKRDDPPPIQKSAPPTDKARIETMIRNGKLLFEMGKYDEAQTILQQVLKDDPTNRTAPYYLDLIKEGRLMAGINHKYDEAAHSAMRFSARNTNLIYTTRGREKILSKLNNIKFDEVSYDLPLKEVLSRVRAESQKRDSNGIGVNFMINQSVDAPDIAADVRIRISPPLKNLRLVDVLDAITKVADKPIRYTVEDFAVVFSPKSDQDPPELYTKRFYVDSTTLARAIQAVLGTGTDAPLLHTGAYFATLGLDLYPPTMILFNKGAGELLVKAPPSELECIQQVIDMLNQDPPVPMDAKSIMQRLREKHLLDDAHSIMQRLREKGDPLPPQEPPLFDPLRLLELFSQPHEEKPHLFASVSP